jgi:putative transposase
MPWRETDPMNERLQFIAAYLSEVYSIWWIKLGIRHQRIAPGRPEQNGAHEHMHRTLKAEATRPSERQQRAQQARFDCFCREYNEERPHEALDYRTPAALYQPSKRQMPAKLPEPPTQATTWCVG